MLSSGTIVSLSSSSLFGPFSLSPLLRLKSLSSFSSELLEDLSSSPSPRPDGWRDRRTLWGNCQSANVLNLFCEDLRGGRPCKLGGTFCGVWLWFVVRLAVLPPYPESPASELALLCALPVGGNGFLTSKLDKTSQIEDEEPTAALTRCLNCTSLRALVRASGFVLGMRVNSDATVWDSMARLDSRRVESTHMCIISNCRTSSVSWSTIPL